MTSLGFHLVGLRYRAWSRLLHRFDLHHTRRIGPMDDGVYIHRCEWCGVSRREVPMWLTEQRMRQAIDERDGHA